MIDEIYNKLIGTDGILESCISDADSPNASFPPLDSETQELFVAALRVLQVTDEESVTILIGKKGSQRKLVACRWPKYHIAVEVIPGHPVSKSLQRILRRVGVRFGGLEVESRRVRNQPCAIEPPAASSNVPTPEISSPSPADATPPIGDSPEAR